jgi:hypothetical protein
MTGNSLAYPSGYDQHQLQVTALAQIPTTCHSLQVFAVFVRDALGEFHQLTLADETLSESDFFGTPNFHTLPLLDRSNKVSVRRSASCGVG